MQTQQSGKFFTGSIITFLLVFVLIQIILMLMQGIAKNVVSPESMTTEDITQRIKPIAEVYIGEAPVIEVEEIITTEPSSNDGASNKVVTQVCAVCHSTGMMSSPKLGDAGDWAPRIEKGIETLYSNAINGLNMMPARGGRSDLSDDEIKAAVDNMISQAQ